MKTFISFRFTDEKLEDFKNLLMPLQDKLKEMGIDSYCSLTDEDLKIRSADFKPQDYVFYDFRILNNVQFMLVLLMSEEKSEGMLMQVGYSLAKGIPVVVTVKEDIKNTYLPGMANLVIKWNDLNDLLEKISKTDFTNLN